MGMMLRRNNRKPDYAPTVNGKVVENAPKKRSLTSAKKNSPAPTVIPQGYQMPNGLK